MRMAVLLVCLFPRFAASGPELVTNGSFTDDSGWVPGVNWSVSGGVAFYSAVGPDSAVLEPETALTLLKGRVYRVRLTVRIDPDAVGQLNVLGKPFTTDGTYIFTFRPSVNTDFSLEAVVDEGNTFEVTIDDVSIREVRGRFRRKERR